MPLAANPSGRVLYASLRSEPWTVLALAIDPSNGRLAKMSRAPLPASMCWISTDVRGRFLLSASYGSLCVAVSPMGGDGSVAAAQQVVETEPNAAIAAVATMLGTSQVGRVAQCKQQRRIRIEPVVNCFAIDGHAGHAGRSLGWRARVAKPRKAAMMHSHGEHRNRAGAHRIY